MNDKPRHLAGLLSDAGFSRAAAASERLSRARLVATRLCGASREAARAFRRALMGEPNYALNHYHVGSKVWQTPEEDRIKTILRGICETDPRIHSAELWEAKESRGFRLETREGGEHIPIKASERDFLSPSSDMRAREVLKGNIIISSERDGGRVVIFNSIPGDFSATGEIKGLSFGNGCWIPIYDFDEKEIRVTHMLALHGTVSQDAGAGNEQLNSLVTFARKDILGEINSQRKEEHGKRDRLTGLWNRGELDRHMLEIAAYSILFSDEGFSIFFTDLDHFGKVNARGHNLGDRVLRGTAREFASLPDVAFAGRYGGEEFVLRVASPSQRAILAIARKLHGLLSNLSFDTPAGRIDVRGSTGVASSLLWKGLKEAERFPEFPDGVASRKEMQEMVDDIRLRIERMRILRGNRDVSAEIARLREMGKEAMWASRDEFRRAIADGMPLSLYATGWRDLSICLADAAMIVVKNIPREDGKTRDGIAQAVVEERELKFLMLDPSKAPEPSAPSGAAADPRQLSLPNRQSSPP